MNRKRLLRTSFSFIFACSMLFQVPVMAQNNERSHVEEQESEFLIDISDRLVKYNGNDIHVTIPEGIKEISPYAFSNAKNLVSVTLPASVELVDGRAFHGAICLKDVIVSEQNEAITSVDGILYDKEKANIICCPKGKSGEITLADETAQITSYAFEDCVNLTNIILPSHLMNISEYAFRNCSNITEMKIPASVTQISLDAFADMSSLSKLSVENENRNYSAPDGMLYDIDRMAILFCPTQKSGDVQIPTGTRIIEEKAFYQCSLVSGVAFPDSMKMIKKNAFNYCTNLLKVGFNEGLESIGYKAFSGCTSLEKAILPESLKEIEDSSFSDCSRLNTVKFPTSIKNIPNSIFSNCSNLCEILIPDGVEKIGDFAFCDCPIKNIVLPKSLKRICDGTFSGCDVDKVFIPAGVEKIGNKIFDNSKNLERIEVSPDNVNYSSINGIVYYNKGTVLCECPSGIKGKVIIADTTKVICNNAFRNCENIDDIRIPAGTEEIEDSAFEECTALKSIAIPAGVKKIGMDIFLKCGPELTIYGTKGSVAEEYASENALKFVSYISGDINSDKKIDISDANLALRMALNIISISPQQKFAADRNEDCSVNLLDCKLILMEALGISNIDKPNESESPKESEKPIDYNSNEKLLLKVVDEFVVCSYYNFVDIDSSLINEDSKNKIKAYYSEKCNTDIYFYTFNELKETDLYIQDSPYDFHFDDGVYFTASVNNRESDSKVILDIGVTYRGLAGRGYRVTCVQKNSEWEIESYTGTWVS